MIENYDDLIKASRLVNPRCPICSQYYEVQKIQILDESAEGVLSYFKCDKCGSSFLASVKETSFGHMAQGLLTDLEADEVLKFAGDDIVSHDDVLEVHQRMEKGNLALSQL